MVESEKSFTGNQTISQPDLAAQNRTCKPLKCKTAKKFQNMLFQQGNFT